MYLGISKPLPAHIVTKIKKREKEIRRLMKKHHRRHDFSERLDLMSAIIELQPDRETVGLVRRNVSSVYHS